MKQTFFFLSILIALCLNASSQSVSEEMALQVANNFYNNQQQGQKSANSLSLYATQNISNTNQKSTHDVAYYIFNDQNKGFVIVSGDQRALPVIAYSTQGNFDTTNMPANLREWLNGYQKEIQYAKENLPEQDAATSQLWTNYHSNNFSTIRKNTQAVSPLLSTTWDQDFPYNALCPYDSTLAERTVVGCVATAMAQIMKFWNYPEQGSGSLSYTHNTYGTLSANFGNTTYNWSAMPNNATTSNTALATLMYHCGVSVAMDYDVADNGGSGAYTLLSDNYISYGYIDARTALKNYFKYDSVIGVYREDYTANNWDALIKAELDAGRPILYSGSGDNGGHAFVCDGYNASNLFHMNWGWSGSSNGYFGLSALNPGSLGVGGGSGGFNSNQKALIQIAPPDDDAQIDMRLYSSISINPAIVIRNQSFSVSANIANYGDATFSGTLSMDIFNSSGYLENVEEKSNITIPSMRYMACTFTSAGTTLAPGTYYLAPFAQQGNEDWFQIDSGDYANIVSFQIQNGLNIEDGNTWQAVVYPNPASSQVFFQATTNIEQGEAMLYDLQGKLVWNQNFSGDKLTVNIEDLPTGLYILTIQTEGNTLKYKVMKQ